MLRYIREYRFYIILFLFVLVPILVIDTTNRAPTQYNWIDKTVVTLSTPVQIVLNWTLDKVVSGFQNYAFLWHVKRENLELQELNRRLLGEIVSLKEVQSENERFRKLLDFGSEAKYQFIGAQVIAKDVSTDFRAVRINRGSDHGVKKDMAVVTHEGVVGRVLRTTNHTADVVTVLDFLSAVPALNSRSRTQGIVEGLTDELCQIRFTLRTDDVQKGDLFVTSGLGGVYPKGLPVGTVVEVKRKPYGITQYIEMKPAVDFYKLEEILVLTDPALNQPGLFKEIK